MGDFYNHYMNMSDQELINFSEYDAKDLRSEALSDFIKVLEERKIKTEKIAYIIKMHLLLQDDNIEKLAIEEIKKTCPICQTEKGINAISLQRILSILIYTKFMSETIVGCKSCLNIEVKAANLFTLICGPWGVPVGLICTPIIILLNIIRFKKLNMEIPTLEMKKLIRTKLEVETQNY